VPQRIEVEDSARVRLSWSNEEVSEFDAATLRANCSCADCLKARETRRIRLTVVGAEPSIQDARLVGDYGISFVFGPDGHRTGIFRWDQLALLGGVDP
jgi:DUF971 family protein